MTLGNTKCEDVVRTCNKCGTVLIVEQTWNLSSKKAGHYECKDCRSVRDKKYRDVNPEKEKLRHIKYAKENPEMMRKHSQNWHKRHPTYYMDKQRSLRLKVIELLGDCCEICHKRGLSYEFFEFHAIGGNHPRKNGKRLHSCVYYEWILSGHLDRVQLLCANCHEQIGVGISEDLIKSWVWI